MVICAFIALVLGVMYARYAATAGQGFGANIRKEEFEKVQNFSFLQYIFCIDQSVPLLFL